VARATLKLTGVYEAWGPHVRQARLQRASGVEAQVLVRVLEGQAATDESLARLREDGRLLARLQHENVLRVEQTSGVGGQLALVHESFDCVAMSHVLAALRARGQVLPSRVAVELAAAVGIALEEALKINDGERRLVHPGPTPAELLVDTAGRVKLAGIRVHHVHQPWPAPPGGYAAPEGPGGWQAATWMVGALLSELLSGEAPTEFAGAAARHDAQLRRVVLRLVARPGDTPPEGLVAAIRQALALDVDTRGTPGAFGRMLRDLSVQLQTPGLRAWAPGTVPAVQRQVAGGRAPAGRTIAPELGVPAPPLAPPLPELSFHDSDPEPTVVGVPVPGRSREVAPPTPETRAVPVSTARPSPQPLAGPSLRSPGPGPTPPAPDPELVGAAVIPGGPRPEAVAAPVSAGPRADAGPAVGSAPRPSVAGPTLTPRLAINAPTMATPLPLVDEGTAPEETVIARLTTPPGAAPAPDPLGVAFAPSSRGGPAPVARAAPEEDEEPPRRSALPLVLGGLTALFAFGALVAVAVAGWYFFGGSDEVPVEPVPTLADVVGTAPEAPSAPAPAAPSPEAALAAPAPKAEAAPAVPPPVAPPAGVAPVAPAPKAEAPKAEAPKAAATVPAPKAEAPKAATPAAKAPAADPDAPVRIRAGSTPTAASTTSAAAAAAPAAPAAAPGAPTTPAAAPAAAPPAAEPSGPFAVSFTAGEPGMNLEVKCMQGGGTGASVQVPDAVKGNCRVVGRAESGTTVMTLVTVSGARSYTCFSGGARTCR